jgi:hypothetical protein
MTSATTVAVMEQHQTAYRIRLAPDQTQTSAEPARAGGVPLTMPREQEYYWQHGWQQGERQVVADLVAGDRVRFDSDDPEDVARWLDAPDDADAG